MLLVTHQSCKERAALYTDTQTKCGSKQQLDLLYLLQTEPAFAAFKPIAIPDCAFDQRTLQPRPARI